MSVKAEPERPLKDVIKATFVEAEKPPVTTTTTETEVPRI